MIKRIILIVFLTVLYFYSFNLINLIPEENAFTQQRYSNSMGTDVKMGVGASVSYIKLSPKIYGTIQTIGDDSKLLLLNFIEIPIKEKGINFLYFHGIFTLMILFIMKGGKMNKKSKVFLWIIGCFIGGIMFMGVAESNLALALTIFIISLFSYLEFRHT